MPGEVESHADCPFRDQIAALARCELDGDARRRAEAHLERHAECRAFFRERTAGRFPEFPNFTIIDQIGKGGFGVVYKAVHHAKEHIEALKVLFGKTSVMTSYFENEVHLIARLRHPNIAMLYDAQLTAPPLYYAMEYVDGVRLNDYLRERDVSLIERIELLRTVALAVDYAHAQGVVHRDIKPQNVLVDREGQPRLVDFGIARRLEEMIEESVSAGRPETPVGTLGYIAPEQVRHGRCDKRADIFSLGALLFHVVTGEPARFARDPRQRLASLRSRNASRAEDLSEIIGCCVADDPNDRYPDCAAFARDLGNYLAGRPIAARRNANWWYGFSRIGAYVIRQHSLAVRVALIVALAALMTLQNYQVGARQQESVAAGEETRMIAFGPRTYQAVAFGDLDDELAEVSVVDNESYRLLYARLLNRLAAAEPLAVAWDFFFPNCRPEYDERFAAAIRAFPAPVIVGVEDFDSEAEPRLCARIREAVDGFGWLRGTLPNYQSKEYEIPFALERGFNELRPTLAVAAFGAARDRDFRPRYRLHRERRQLEIYYERRERAGDGARWLPKSDRLPLLWVRQVEARVDLHDLHVRSDDVVAHARVPAKPKAYWDARTIEIIDVLRASDEQVREWFHDRVLLVGWQHGPLDMRPNGLGEMIYGVQVHADAIHALMTGAFVAPFNRVELAVRALAWCCLAGLVATWLPSPAGRRRTRPIQVASLLAILVGQWLALAAAVYEFRPLTLNLFFGMGAFLTALGVLTFVRTITEQRIEVDPTRRSSGSDDESTLPTTVLAETH